jgi:hypothetical protein
LTMSAVPAPPGKATTRSGLASAIISWLRASPSGPARCHSGR